MRDLLELPEFSVLLEAADTCGARPPLLPAARRRGGIRPARGHAAEAVTAAVARSDTPEPCGRHSTAPFLLLLLGGWLSVAACAIYGWGIVYVVQRTIDSMRMRTM